MHFDPPHPNSWTSQPPQSPPPLKKVPGYATVRGRSYRKPGTLGRRYGVRKKIAGAFSQSRQCDRRQSYHKVASLCSASVADDVAVYKIAARDRPTSASQSRIRRSLKALSHIHRVHKSYYTREQSCELDSNRAKTTSLASRRQNCTAGIQDLHIPLTATGRYGATKGAPQLSRTNNAMSRQKYCRLSRRALFTLKNQPSACREISPSQRFEDDAGNREHSDNRNKKKLSCGNLFA